MPSWWDALRLWLGRLQIERRWQESAGRHIRPKGMQTMITDIWVKHSAGQITVRTATEADRRKYVQFELEETIMHRLRSTSQELGIDTDEIIWSERVKLDGLLLAIEENQTHEVIGFCSIDSPKSKDPTLGIRICQAEQGKGYGYSAAKAMVELGWMIFPHDHFWWEVHQENEASRRIALKLGGTYSGRKGVIPKDALEHMRSMGIEIGLELLADSIERYKIFRPERSPHP